MKISNVFFRKMTDQEVEGTKKALPISYYFLICMLFLHSIYEYIKTSNVSDSLYIMLAGLGVFFLASYLMGRRS